MQTSFNPNPTRPCHLYAWLALLIPWAPACDSTLPSARMNGGQVRLPIPTNHDPLPGPERLTRIESGEVIELTPLKLIRIAFDQQPDIKSSYQRFKQEEARYDFFVVSRDSLTPRLRTINRYGEKRDPLAVGREREHVVEFSIEKQFFDTTELNFGIGVRTLAVDEALGTQPFLSASLRYPLSVSREKLERTSEEIFRRNELNDAQLDYIQTVRRRLERTLFSFYDVVSQSRQLKSVRRWSDDLEELMGRLDGIVGRNLTTDRLRIEAERARVRALAGEMAGRYEIDLERLKSACGIPFHVRLELVDEPFNPFTGATHEELLKLGIQTDPEIATLRNEQRNAEVELDLARRGRWDVTMLLDGETSLEGGGEDDGISDWSLSFGLDVAMVDSRVTDSLARQAQANITRFAQAIIARENEVFVDTLEPIIRIETLGKSRDELAGNLSRFRQDYLTGVEKYVAGTLNIDDLLKRRDILFEQEQQISRLTQIVGANVSELCTATGKFFELINKSGGG